MEEKHCFKCNITKPLTEFYRHNQMADGHLNKCKTCTKKDVRRRYYDPEVRPAIKAYEKARLQDPQRREKIAEYQRQRILRTPGKVRARKAISNGIRDKKIQREPCWVCGEEKSQAHHIDYRSKTAVVWVCFKHHREMHGQLID